jgi:hypothetical protein
MQWQMLISYDIALREGCLVIQLVGCFLLFMFNGQPDVLILCGVDISRC